MNRKDPMNLRSLHRSATSALAIAATAMMACAHSKSPDSPSTAAAPPTSAIEKQVDAYFVEINRLAEKAIGVPIRYSYDRKSFSSIDADALDSIKEVVGSTEYQLRLFAKRDQLTKDKVAATVKSVVLVAGSGVANPDSDFEWNAAKSEATEAVAKANPNDILYDQVGQDALYRHFLTVRLDGSTLVLECRLKNCRYARRGSQNLEDRLMDLVLR